MRALIFDRMGRLRTEISPQCQSVGWRLNEVGQAALYLPYVDPACSADNLHYGNRALIQFANGLPDWGGVLDPPLKCTAEGVHFTAYTAERILSWRRTPKTLSVAGTPGRIFEAAINAMNATGPTGVEIGEVYGGGEARERTYHLENVHSSVITLAREAGMDFALLPVFVGGLLVFRAHWWHQRGQDRSGQVALVDGMNCEVAMDEQGFVANRAYISGQGSTWGDERPVVPADDAASQSLYGLREFARVQSGAGGSVTALKADAAAAVAEMARPRQRVTATATNKAPALFGDYDMGDTLRVTAFPAGGDDWALDGGYRLRAREWRADGTCRLVLGDE
jgi:hypothetical protein